MNFLQKVYPNNAIQWLYIFVIGASLGVLGIGADTIWFYIITIPLTIINVVLSGKAKYDREKN